MSNYVSHRVVCREEVLYQYFIDKDPFGDGRTVEPPYISFNKLMNVKSLNEYSEKYGVYISYGCGFTWSLLGNGFCEIKFCTRWEYPIRAIIRTLELSHDSFWFAVEENHIYISKFYWEDGVKEDVLFIEEEYSEWLDSNMEFDVSLEDSDDSVWYFLPSAAGKWHNWESTDGFARYMDVAAVYVQLPPGRN